MNQETEAILLSELAKFKTIVQEGSQKDILTKAEQIETLFKEYLFYFKDDGR